MAVLDTALAASMIAVGEMGTHDTCTKPATDVFKVSSEGNANGTKPREIQSIPDEVSALGKHWWYYSLSGALLALLFVLIGGLIALLVFRCRKKEPDSESTADIIKKIKAEQARQNSGDRVHVSTSHCQATAYQMSGNL